MDLEKSKKKISAIKSNIAIYKNDLKRMEKGLEKQFGISEDEADERILEIDEELEVFGRKKKKLKREIESELDNVNA